MNGEGTRPALRGPLGVQELFVLRPDGDLFRIRRSLALPLAFFLAGLGIVGLISWWLFRLLRFDDIDEALWAFTSTVFIASEMVFGALGARGGAAALAAYRRHLRLEEIRLTLLRPVTVGQLILHPSPRLVRLLVAGCWLGYAVGLLRWRGDHAIHLVPAGLIALNALVTWTTSAWIHLALALGLTAPLQRLSASAVLTLVYILGSALVGGVFALTLFTVVFVTDSPLGQFDVVLSLALIPVAALFWLFKILLARAHVARLEQVVFPHLSE